MNKALPFAVAFAGILMLSVGCGGSEEMTEPVGTQLTLVVEPSDPAAEETTVFTVTASSGQAHITSIALDYTNDGSWDDTRTFDAASVTAAFSWIYQEPGQYWVRAEVRDATDTPTEKLIEVTVAEARSVDVSYLLIGTSAEGGNCNAYGPPAVCSGCSATLGNDFSTAMRRPLGRRDHGSVVTLTQAFNQGPYTGGQDILYACSFSARVVIGIPPYERTFATGGCTTSSRVIPARLSCSAVVSGVVP